MHEVMGSIITLHKSGMVAHTYNSCSPEVETRRSEIQDHPCNDPCNEFKASLSYMKPCLSKKRHPKDQMNHSNTPDT